MKKKVLTLALIVSVVGSGCGALGKSASTSAISEPDIAYEAVAEEGLAENFSGMYEGTEELAADNDTMAEVRYSVKEAMPADYDPGFQETEWNTEEYSYHEENGFLLTRTEPFSTFAADVDTASYANLRRQLRQGGYVNIDSVRIEELINYFSYDYPEPKGDEPFSVTTELTDTPWNPDTKLLHIGLQAKRPDYSELPASNLVFLIDVSGSMDEANKLPLVQRSFMTLVENLNPRDKVSIITYSSGEDIIIDGKDGDYKNDIMAAIESLTAAGSTNGESALQMAYDVAKKHFVRGGNNRIIMATDGDFNVGITSEGDLTRMVKEKAKDGIFLSVLGFGMGNYKDNKLEALADNGNGNYAYIDDIAEARKVLVEEMGGTLFAVAKDVKLQVEFNPQAVKGYRLIGYENRKMAAEDFHDDRKDGGELGAGHSVTALYEIVTVDSDYDLPDVTSRYGNDRAFGFGDNHELLSVNIRYKDVDSDTSKLLEYPVDGSAYVREPSNDLIWAAGVAQCGMLIKQSPFAGNSSFRDIRETLYRVANDDYKEEFVYLIREMERAVVDG